MSYSLEDENGWITYNNSEPLSNDLRIEGSLIVQGSAVLTEDRIAEDIVAALSIKKTDLPLHLDDERAIVKKIVEARLNGDIKLEG